MEPAEATFDIAAVSRVEPEGFAPTATPSGVFTIDSIARVEPVGEIPAVPDAPTGHAVAFDHTTDGEGFITAVDGSASQSWSNNDPENTDLIRVQEATDTGFTEGFEEQELAGDATSAVWTNHKDGVTRYYRVRAENGSGPSAWASTVSVKHIQDVPGDPQNVAPSAATATSITRSWDAPISGGPVSTYHAEDDKDGGFGNRVTTAATSSNFVGLTEGAAYAWRVRAVGPDNQVSGWVQDISASANGRPTLSGCSENEIEPSLGPHVLKATDNAENNEDLKIFRNGSLYDTVTAAESYSYEPADQSGSWHVVSSGGSAG
ncbi:MAG: fibronectin type III domain-containing protein, partial [Gemmatimonadota bacterium]